MHCCLSECFRHCKAPTASLHPSFFHPHRPLSSFLPSSPNPVPNFSKAGGGWVGCWCLWGSQTAFAQKPLSPLAPPAGSSSSKASLGILGQKVSHQLPPCCAPGTGEGRVPRDKPRIVLQEGGACLAHHTCPQKWKFLNCQDIIALLNLDS